MKKNNTIKNLEESGKIFIVFAMGFIVMQWVLRIFEFVLSNINHNVYELSEVGLGFVLDLIFGLSFSFSFFVIYFLIYQISKRASKVLSIVVFLVMIISAYGFSRYFSIMSYPLDKVIFSYPISELYLLAQTDGGINLFFIVSILVLGAISYSSYFLIGKIRFSKRTLLIALILMLVSFLIERPANKFCEQKCTRKAYIASVNKTRYFINDIYTLLNQIFKEKDIMNLQELNTYQSYYKDRSFTDHTYPLLHIGAENSVLSEYMRKTDKPPNIVIIVVESLTRCFSGIGADKGSYTPFLDSLADVGLYWENFTSTSERTIGAIPGILGSLPSSNDGFSTMAGSMPNYLSLISVLGRNNYQTNFFYGGIASSDNVNIFLTRQGLDNMQSGNYYNKNGLTYFGLTDSTIYSRSLTFMQKHKKQPFLNIYLTLSTHGPFDFLGLESLQEYVLRKWPKVLNDQQLEYLENNSEMLTSFFYADQQIKKLFYALKRNGNIDNTIFIVTGDHGISKACPNNVIKKYHIPLILYSPQLKRSKNIKSINSHYNITPALLAFLQQDYNIKIPKQVHWLGSDFDTSSQVQSKIPIPIMEINRSVVEVIYKDYFLSKGKLYHIKDGLRTDVITNDSITKKMKELLESYVNVNHVVCNNNKLLPKSIYNRWVNDYVYVDSSFSRVLNIDSTIAYYRLWALEGYTSNSNYRIKLDFDLKSNIIDPRCYPKFVLELTDSMNSKISYNSLIWVNKWQVLDTSISNHFSFSLETSIPNDIEHQKCQLKAYLWNNSGIELKLENVEVNLFKQKQ